MSQDCLPFPVQQPDAEPPRSFPPGAASSVSPRPVNSDRLHKIGKMGWGRGESGMRRTIQGTRLLITGASSGIGRALARLAAEAGARVAVAARSGERLEELARELSEAS